MLAEDSQRFIYKEIVNTIDDFQIQGHEASDLGVKVLYANQFVNVELPVVTLQYITSGIVSHAYINDLYENRTKTTESWNWEGPGVYKTRVDPTEKMVHEDNHEWSIENIIVTLDDGTGHYWMDTYTRTVDDYTHINITDDGNIEVGSNFEDIIDKEDDDDEILELEVTYNHEGKVAVVLGGEFSDTLQIDVYTTDMNVDGEHINGIVFNKKLANELRKKLRFGTRDPHISIRSVGNVSDMTSISGERYRYRRSFDVSIAYMDMWTEYYDTIDEAEYAVNIQKVD